MARYKVKWTFYLLVLLFIAIPVIILMFLFLSPNSMLGISTSSGLAVDLSKIGTTSPSTSSRVTIGGTDYQLANNTVDNFSGISNSLLSATGKTNANIDNSAVATDLAGSHAKPKLWFWLLFILMIGVAALFLILFLIKPSWLVLCCCNGVPIMDNHPDCGCNPPAPPPCQQPCANAPYYAPPQYQPQPLPEAPVQQPAPQNPPFSGGSTGGNRP